MISHYLKPGFRTLTRQKAYSLINILGLSTGIASFILILLFLQNELGYEKHIPRAADTYRLVEIQVPAGIEVQHVAITSGPWAPHLKEGLPELEDVVRVMPTGGNVLRAGDKVLRQRYTYYADPSVFPLFAIDLASGNPNTALVEPNTAVLSVSMAERLFSTGNVLGRTFHYGNTPYRVSGVMRDQTHNSHLRFEVLLSYATAEAMHPALQHFGNNSLATYLLLREGSRPQQTEENIRNLVEQYFTETGAPPEAHRPDMYLQPLEDIYLRSQHIKFSIYNARGDINLVYVFTAVAILILLIACINFINLSTARSSRRALEVGIRKVAGARPAHLLVQFLGESVILTFIALLVAVGLVELFLPGFNSLLGTDLRIAFLGNWIFNIGLFGLLLVVGFVAGIYPALFMSRFRPASVLKSGKGGGRNATGVLRKVLVVFQFAISALLVFSTFTIFHQWQYLRSKDLGINYENIISAQVLQRNTNEMQFRNLKNELLSHPGVTGVAAASGMNGIGPSQGPVLALDSVEAELMVRFGFVDEDYFSLMEVPVVAGRNFSRDFGTDHREAMLLNEAAVRALGWEEPIGHRIRANFVSEEPFSVIGVVQDYNYFNLQSTIEPAVYLLEPERYTTVVVKYRPEQRQSVLVHMEQTWKDVFQDLPFEPEFAMDTILGQYDGESNVMKVVTYFAILCIIISALGLYGLAAFVAEQKKREIGIRKVLGDTVTGVIVLLQKDFLRLVLVAVAIALPLSWLAMDRYLGNYAYRIEQSWWHFGATLMVVLTIAFLTILYHAFRAAVANPVDSIKSE